MEIASLVEEHVCKGADHEACMDVAKVLHSLGASKSDVAEIFSPERFTSRANEFGLRPGFAVDLSVPRDSSGECWDLSRKKGIEELFRKLRYERPLFLIGLPIRGPFSPQNLTKFKRDPKEFEQSRKERDTCIRLLKPIGNN